MCDAWYEALDKKGRRLGVLLAKNEEDAMSKARNIYGLAVIEVNWVDKEMI